jgi:hypothetical protein
MTSSTATGLQATPTSTYARPVASLRDDAIGVLFGLALVGGVLADAWAHANVLQGDEGFFTPWHALLYGGFAGTAAWTWWQAFRRRHDPRWWRNSWPAGYALGAAGSLFFLVGGVGDMIWHQIFGIETSLRAALSPSHLVIAGSAVLLLTSQTRSWWASGEGGWRSVTGVASLAFGSLLGMLLVQSMTAANTIAPTRVFERVAGTPSHLTPAGQGVQSYLLGTVVLLIPFLLVQRRRGTPGVATAITGTLGLFMMLQREFPMPQTVALLGLIVGAAVVDFLLFRIDVTRGPQAPLRLPIAGAVFAVGIWTGHLIGLQIAAGVRWPVEIWAGTVVECAALGFLLGVLAAGKPATADIH